MRHKEVVYLLSYTTTYDALGNPITEPTEKMVYANEFSISNQDYFAAAQNGLKPTLELEIYSFEYDGETKLKKGDDEYHIMRANTKGDKTRITCEKV